MKKQAELLSICVAEEFKVKRYFKTENDKIRELESIIEQLDQFNNTEGNYIRLIGAAHIRKLWTLIKSRAISLQPSNYQVSKEVVHELEFGDLAVIQI